MGRNKKPLPLLKSIYFTDIGEAGKAVGRFDDKVVFAKGAVPGDVADVQVYRKKNSFFEGNVTQIGSYSDLRTTPFCNHFELCGGCSWQNMKYEAQANFKEKKATDALKRLGGIEPENWLPIVQAPAIKYHRNKLEFTFSTAKWLTDEEIKSQEEFSQRNGLGFHLPGKFDKVLHIKTCFLQDEKSNLIRNFVFQKSNELKIPFFHLREQTGILRNLIVRNTTLNHWMVILSITKFTDDVQLLLNQMIDQFSFLTSVYYVVNAKRNDSIADLTPQLFWGDSHISETFVTPNQLKISYQIGPKTFFQTNSKQAEKMYQLAFEMAKPQPNETMYDLYTGAGTIALFFARAVKNVVGIEYIEEAIADAKINAEVNQIKNAKFFAGDMKDVFTEDFIAQNGKPDFIVTDPPRAGMHADVVNTLKKLAPKRLVYISCNPATQARDLKELIDIYQVETSVAVDMFPHTNHVENIVLLRKKT